MKRTKDTTIPRIYAYGCLSPTTGFDAAMHELERQHDLWDALVAIEQVHNQSQLEHAKQAVPAIASLTTRLDATQALFEAVLAQRRELRRQARAKIETPDLDQQLSTLAKNRREIRTELYVELKDWRRENKELLTTLEQHRREAVKQAAKLSPTFWSNKARVLDDYERARRTVAKFGRKLRPIDRSRPKGVLHISHPAFNVKRKPGDPTGLTFEQLLRGDCSSLTITPVPPHTYDPETPRGERKRLSRTTLSLRVDAVGNRMTLPVILHRPVPPEARIKCAQLTWVEEGERLRFTLCLTISLPKEPVDHPSRSACGIDLGWRKLGDELLIATIASTNHDIERLTLPSSWMQRMDKVERLTGYLADETLLLAHQLFTDPDQSLPAPLSTPFNRWHPGLSAQYIDTHALHDAVRALDFEVPAPVLRWYKRYRHLLLYRDNLRAKLLRRRREIYRLAARHIAQTHHTVSLEELNLAQLARTKTRADGSEPALHAQARAQRQRACLHQFRHELTHQINKAGGELVLVKGPSTMTCRQCGHLNKPADRAAQHWTCEGCATLFDQDINAATNLLTAGTGERFGEGERVITQWESGALRARIKT